VFFKKRIFRMFNRQSPQDPHSFSFLRPLRGVLTLATALALAAPLAGCEKKADEAAPVGAGAAVTPAAAAAAKLPKTSLKVADVDTWYESIVDGIGNMNKPMGPRLDAFAAKLGKPVADDGRKKTWYALDGDKCSKIDLDNKDGSLNKLTTAKSDCGL
jgi:hypothetical protein